MDHKYRRWMSGLGLLALLAAQMGAAQAQSTDGKEKEKERMYTYIALWAMPRAKWAEMDKPVPANQKVLDQGLSDGTLLAYGSDFNLVHEADGYTHDSFWSSHSMAGVLNILDAFDKAGTSTSSVLTAATKHSDEIMVTRHYNWHSGTYKGAYTHGSFYKLKPTAPDDAVDTIAKAVFEPLMEKLLAEGAIIEYEVDEQAIHTGDPNNFWLFYLTPNAEGIDKVNAAVRAAVKSNALIGPALDSMIDWTPHRDSLDRTTVTFK